MTIIANDDFAATLRQTARLAEVRDSSAKLLGYFSPVFADANEQAAAIEQLGYRAHDLAAIGRIREMETSGKSLRQIDEDLLPEISDEEGRRILREAIHQLEELDGCGSP